MKRVNIILTTLLTLTLGITYANAAWTNPPSTPPTNNTEAPLNVGNTDQIKGAGLGLLGNLSAVSLFSSTDVTGKRFCLNNDCITTWPTGSGGVANINNGRGLTKTTSGATTTLAADFNVIQTILKGGACTTGQIVQSINSVTGDVTCIATSTLGTGGTGGGPGNGTQNSIPLWATNSTLGSSRLTQDASYINVTGGTGLSVLGSILGNSGSFGTLTTTGDATIGGILNFGSGVGGNTSVGTIKSLASNDTSISGHLNSNYGMWIRRSINQTGVSRKEGIDNSGSLANTPIASTIALFANAIERLTINTAGNVGIANTNPTEKLDVAGNLRLSGAFMPNNVSGTAGQVLRSNGANTAPTWVSTSTLGVGGLTGGIANALPLWTGPNSIASSRVTQDANYINVTGGTGLSVLGSILGNSGYLGTLQITGDSGTGGLEIINGARLKLTGPIFGYSGIGSYGQVLQSRGSQAPEWVSTSTLGISGGTGGGPGTGTVGKLPFWNTANTLGDSSVTENSLSVQIAKALGVTSLISTGDVDVGGKLTLSKELITNSTPGTNGQVLISKGANTAPQWVATSTLGVGSSLSGGVANTIPLWTSASQIANSILTQVGTAMRVVGGSLTVDNDVTVGGKLNLSKELFTNSSAGTAGQVLQSNGAGNAPSWGNAQSGVPAGAVMAFDLASCPAGWSQYGALNGRNIVGASGAWPYRLGDQAGESAHVMTLAELVRHSHDTHRYKPTYTTDTVKNASSDYQTVVRATPGESYIDGPQSDDTGSGNAFNVMDPYVALLYCKKN